MKLKQQLTLTAIGEPTYGTSAKGEWEKRTFLFTTGKDLIPMVSWNFGHELPEIGRPYDVEFYINGREWQGKYFVDLSLDSITHTEAPAQPKAPEFSTTPRQMPKVEKSASHQQMYGPKPTREQLQERNQVQPVEENDLPF